jgi:hypothetical protein
MSFVRGGELGLGTNEFGERVLAAL